MASRRHPIGNRARPHRPHPFRKAAEEEIGLITGWLRGPIKESVEWLLRFGVRPSAETILHIEGTGQFPVGQRSDRQDRENTGSRSP